MNINDTPEQAKFRRDIRAWIKKNVPARLQGRRQGIVQGPGIPAEEYAPIRKALIREGWLAPSFPKEYGGAGFDALQMIIFNEEFQRAGVPGPPGGTGGLNNVSQILFKYGTEAQKQRWLLPGLKGEITWCQGYSEPGAGSDLASLKVRADKVDGGYVINGQKIWTSMAHKADWIYLLARTDQNAKPRQKGISFFIFSMKTPGITIRPIITIDDHHHFNETFYDNVKVPEDALVGKLNEGWTVAKALLVHERLNHIAANPQVLGEAIQNLKSAARSTAQNGGMLWDDPDLRRRVVQLEMDADSLRATRYRSVTKISRGEVPGDETMVFKSFGCELFQRIVAVHHEVVGPAGVIWGNDLFGEDAGEIAMHACNIRAATIRGGTSEVQRNVVSKRVLGLPDVGPGSRSD
ncbi:MAG: acyl-CoA dehydrogenase family protein [Candidatus Lambdaproteobacteria bacterium]|nr:acyl-CoA dehydrogenase family protein [Candidatus Lambdaproteobacteria bacterium]